MKKEKVSKPKETKSTSNVFGKTKDGQVISKTDVIDSIDNLFEVLGELQEHVNEIDSKVKKMSEKVKIISSRLGV
tara:strand:+ start:164 stop:388 length:225 start_codon:yes stop_codon:yes gene_type:complete